MQIQGLSARETALLSSWERERRSRITVEDLRHLIGGSALLVAKRMAKKGVLERVGRGVYTVRPLRALPRRASPSAPVLAAYLLADQPYYLGGLWGLTFHRLTTQQYVSVLDAFVPNRRRPRVVQHARVTFHVLKPAAFAYGVQTALIEGTPVKVSEPERTVLDLLDYPDLAGGLLIALEHAREALPKLEVKRLIAHATQGSRLSTCQRIGVLPSGITGCPRTWTWSFR